MKKVLLFLVSLNLSANCDYLVKDKTGYHFQCSKVKYSKEQVRDINKRLFRVKVMPIYLEDRKLSVRFNHYKVLTVTQRLNRDQLEQLEEIEKELARK
jgi:hypothetical protein